MQVAFLASSVLWCGAGPTFGLGFFRIVTFEHFGYFAAIIFSVGDVFSGKNLILGAGNPSLLCKIYEFMVNPPTTKVAGFPPPFMGGGVLTKDTVIPQLRRPDGSHHRKKTNNSVSICTSYAACVLSFLSSGYRTLSVASVTWILRSTSGTLAES